MTMLMWQLSTNRQLLENSNMEIFFTVDSENSFLPKIFGFQTAQDSPVYKAYDSFSIPSLPLVAPTSTLYYTFTCIQNLDVK